MIRRSIAALLLALCALLALAGTAQAASTHHAHHHRAHHRVHHHAKHHAVRHHKKAKPKPKPPSCPGYAHRARGTVALTDPGTSTHSTLVEAMVRLICSAAPDSTINVRMYFAYFNGPAPSALLRALTIVHQWRHVRVNVVQQDSPGHPWVPLERKLMPWAHSYACVYGCQAGTAVSKAHSKWITVSRMQNGSGPGVLITSANISVQQLGTWEAGTLTTGDRKLYDRIAYRMHADERCASLRVHHCALRASSHAFDSGTSAGLRFYVSPAANDPTAADLARLSCAGGGSIMLASLDMPRRAVLTQIDRLHAQGCSVRYLIEHAHDARRGYQWRYKIQHNKFLIVHTARHGSVLYTGSDNFTPNGVASSDNVTLRLTAPGVLATYTHFWESMWARSSAGPIYVPPSQS